MRIKYTAAVARKVAGKQSKNKVKKEIRQILRDIKHASKHGEYSMTVFALPKEVTTVLRRMGYEIDYEYVDPNGHKFVLVSWEGWAC